jgi:pyruvate dehydrogenase E1 component alpha subunit
MTIEREPALAMLRAMIRIRRFEEACAEDYAAGKIRGFLHLYIGQVAVAAGVVPALGTSDSIVATYREHAHALLRGISADAIMAEMYGKLGGCCRGRGGSMHLFSRERRFFGGNAIVGGGLPIGIGIALADKLRGVRAVTCVFFGEGAAAEGEFHESLNLASLWRLPVMFVCENNLYAMGTALARWSAEPEIHKKAAVHRIGTDVVDGMDVVAVTDVAARAVERVRESGAPWFLECMTYRFRAHSMFDPELYRDKAEVEEWK